MHRAGARTGAFVKFGATGFRLPRHFPSCIGRDDDIRFVRVRRDGHLTILLRRLVAVCIAVCCTMQCIFELFWIHRAP